MNAKGKVIATDLDGTLFFPKRIFRMLTRRNKIFLRNFIDEGGRLLIVSGRNHLYLNKVKEKIKRQVDDCGCNSAFIDVDNKEIKNVALDNKRIKEVLIDIKKRFDVSGIFLMTESHNMIMPKKQFKFIHRIGYKFYELFQGTYAEVRVKSDELIKQELDHGRVYKVMMFFGISKKTISICMEANRRMRELYPDLEFSWCGELIEITPKGCSKAEGIKQYLDYLKIKHHNVMVVGDSGNDISMFRSFENSFCMSHASMKIRKYANHIIYSVSDLEKYLDKEEEIKGDKNL